VIGSLFFTPLVRSPLASKPRRIARQRISLARSATMFSVRNPNPKPETQNPEPRWRSHRRHIARRRPSIPPQSFSSIFSSYQIPDADLGPEFRRKKNQLTRRTAVSSTTARKNIAHKKKRQPRCRFQLGPSTVYRGLRNTAAPTVFARGPITSTSAGAADSIFETKILVKQRAPRTPARGTLRENAGSPFRSP